MKNVSKRKPLFPLELPSKSDKINHRRVHENKNPTSKAFDVKK
jgi:hypothetical protein